MSELLYYPRQHVLKLFSVFYLLLCRCTHIAAGYCGSLCTENYGPLISTYDKGLHVVEVNALLYSVYRLQLTYGILFYLDDA